MLSHTLQRVCPSLPMTNSGLLQYFGIRRSRRRQFTWGHTSLEPGGKGGSESGSADKTEITLVDSSICALYTFPHAKIRNFEAALELRVRLNRASKTTDDCRYVSRALVSMWKSCPCFNMEIKHQVTQYCWKEEKLLLQEQFLLFSHNIFNITPGVKLHIRLWNVVVWYISPQLCKSDMSKYGCLKVFQRVPWTSR